MEFVEPRRARRRRLTATVAKRRRSDLIRLWHAGNPSPSHRASKSPYYWAKQGIGSCPCRKKHPGAPRRDRGMCDLGARNRIYRLRVSARELNRLTHRCVDWDSDEVALLSGSVVNDLW